jgi:hypothetical protein
VIRSIELGENSERAFEIGLAVFVRAGVPRGAVQKLDAEFLLEIADVLRDRRTRQAELPAGFGEAAEFNDFDESA